MLYHWESRTKKGKEKGTSFKALTLMQTVAADWKDSYPPEDNDTNKVIRSRSARKKDTRKRKKEKRKKEGGGGGGRLVGCVYCVQEDTPHTTTPRHTTPHHTIPRHTARVCVFVFV